MFVQTFLLYPRNYIRDSYFTNIIIIIKKFFFSHLWNKIYSFEQMIELKQNTKNLIS